MLHETYGADAQDKCTFDRRTLQDRSRHQHGPTAESPRLPPRCTDLAVASGRATNVEKSLGIGRSLPVPRIGAYHPCVPNQITTCKEVVERLRGHHAALRNLGVRRLALFGSVARNEGTASSDVDLLVEFERGRKTYDTWIELAELLESVLQRKVDLVTLEGLSPFLGPHILAEAVDVLRAA